MLLQVTRQEVDFFTVPRVVKQVKKEPRVVKDVIQVPRVVKFPVKVTRATKRPKQVSRIVKEPSFSYDNYGYPKQTYKVSILLLH